MNLIWCSRHVLAADQIADLRVFMGLGDNEPINITTENVVWEATANALADWNRNRETWVRLAASAEADGRLHNRMPHIGGVFPPVALEARVEGVRLLSPVSRQVPEMRKGEGAIPYVHVRWSTF
jgi:hypothetical protein